jgi:hypothetical protein
MTGLERVSKFSVLIEIHKSVYKRLLELMGLSHVPTAIHIALSKLSTDIWNAPCSDHIFMKYSVFSFDPD